MCFIVTQCMFHKTPGPLHLFKILCCIFAAYIKVARAGVIILCKVRINFKRQDKLVTNNNKASIRTFELYSRSKNLRKRLTRLTKDATCA